MNSQLTWLGILCLCFSGCTGESGTEPGAAPTGNQAAGPDGGAGGGGGRGGGGGGDRGGGGGGGRGGGEGRGGGGLDLSAMFGQSDADGDGKLSGDEIPGRWRGRLAGIDTDGDGAVALGEFEAHMQQLRERGGPGGGRPGRGGRGAPSSDRPQRPESE